MRKLLKNGRGVLALLLLFLALYVALQFRPAPPLPALPQDYHASRAVWVGVTWVMDAHPNEDIAQLARDLQAHHIQDAFIYVSYLKPDDAFNPTYAHAADFVQQFRRVAPQITLLAWIGLPVQVTRSDGTYQDNRLEDAATRQAIADFAAQAVTVFGFDGVHLNAESIREGDAAFLATLDGVRLALPGDAILSTTAHALRLQAAVTVMPYPLLPHNWSPEYLRQVAERSDQVALMAYDSGLFFPADYRSWVAYQVRQGAAALADSSTDFLVGLPAWEEWTITHQLHVESLQNALYGFYSGLNESATLSAVDGIALYAYWEITPDEWAQLDAVP